MGTGRHQQMYNVLMSGGATGIALRPHRRVIASANMLMRFARSSAPPGYLVWAIKAAQIVVEYLYQNINLVAEMYGQAQADRILACYAGYLAALERGDRRVVYRGCPVRHHNCLMNFVCYRARQIYERDSGAMGAMWGRAAVRRWNPFVGRRFVERKYVINVD